MIIEPMTPIGNWRQSHDTVLSVVISDKRRFTIDFPARELNDER